MRTANWRRMTSGAAAIVIALTMASCSAETTATQERGGGRRRQPLPNPPVTELTKHVNRDRIIRLTQQLVRINSEYEYKVVHNHKEISDFIAKELRSFGMQVEVVAGDPDFPVVVGRLKGATGKPTLGFATHYNNVKVGSREKWSFDPHSGEYKDGKIYGRGAANSKGSVAGDIETARALKESGIKRNGDLVVVFMPGEGATEFAMPWVVKNRPELIRADWYMGGGGGGNFTRMHAGHVWFKLIVHGTQVHPPCTANGCVNAVEKLLKVLPRVIKVEDWLTWKAEPPFETRKPTADVTKIVAGHQINMIADRAEADIDMRTLPNMTQPQIEKALLALLDRLKKDDPEIDVDIEWIWKSIVPYSDWFKVTEGDPIFKAIAEVAPKYTGREPEWSNGVGGGAGRPDLWELGSKVIYFGVGGGGGGGAHGIDEFVTVDGIVRKARFQVELAAKVLGAPTPTSSADQP